jgi:hypothetical protein
VVCACGRDDEEEIGIYLFVVFKLMSFVCLFRLLFLSFRERGNVFEIGIIYLFVVFKLEFCLFVSSSFSFIFSSFFSFVLWSIQ